MTIQTALLCPECLQRGCASYLKCEHDHVPEEHNGTKCMFTPVVRCELGHEIVRGREKTKKYESA